MNFLHDLSEIRLPSKVTFQLAGTALPSSNDIYFRAKQKELVEQYEGARLFLNETEMHDMGHWFESTEDEVANKAFEVIFAGYLYEAALMYYNVVVDLSWTMTYTAIEYACTLKGKRVDITGMRPIDEAVEMLRKAENYVTSPTAEENPFGYLRLMAPDFSEVIDHIVSFWNGYSDSEIRKKYNYCKHKGKPRYLELEDVDNSKFFSVYIEKNHHMYEMATSSEDIMCKYSLQDAIDSLKAFDDEQLFIYVKELIEKIERTLSPSPMAT